MPEALPTRGTIHDMLDRDLENRIVIHTASQDYMGTLLAVGRDTIIVSDDGQTLSHIAIAHIVKWQRLRA
jgi:hypothetical protein